MHLRQLFDPESSTFTFLVADAERREAVLIDPVLGQVDRDLKLLSELGLELTFVLDLDGGMLAWNAAALPLVGS